MKTLKILSVCLFLGQFSFAVFGQERPPIIDMHMHVGVPLDLPAGAPAPCLPEPCTGKGKATAGPAANLKKTLEMMNEYNIVKGFLSDLDQEQLYKWKEAAPERFIISPFILDPSKASVDQIMKELENERLAGMGEIAAQLMGIPPNDPGLEPFFALAEEFEVPVLIHMEGIGPPIPSFRSSSGSPLLLEEVLVKHPKMKIFIENSGYPYLDEMIALMYQ